MMLKYVVAIFSIFTVFACDQTQKSTTLPSGYDYEVFTEANGEKPNPGDFVYFTFKVEGDDGKVLQNLTDKKNMPAIQIPKEDAPVQEPNPVAELLAMSSVGDSVAITMPIDSMPRKNPMVENMQYIKYIMSVKDIKTEAENEAYIEEMRVEEQMAVEKAKARLPEVEAIVAETMKKFKAGSLDLKETPEGLKYYIHEEGTGENVAEGSRASMQYYGNTYDGKMFDNSFKRGRPFTFTVGRGEVIQGWDIGVPQLKKGSKASFFIPYNLAYGEAGSPPNIGEKEDLHFYVEVEDFN